MQSLLKVFERINEIPFIPRICLFSVIGLVVLFLMWSATSPLIVPPSHAQAITSRPRASNDISPLIFGTNLELSSSQDQVLKSASTRRLLQQIHTRIIRMPVRTNLSEDTELEAAQDIQKLGAVPLIVLQGPMDANALIDDMRIISDMNSIFGNSTVYYEYGDVPDLVGVSAQKYTKSWNAIVPLLKQHAPHASFVGPVTYRYNQSYLTTFLKGAQPRPDDVSWHEYACVAADSEDTCLAGIDQWTTHITDARSVMKATIGTELPIMITEWNYAPDASAKDGKSNDSVFLSEWTLKALQTLAANHIFASMQYSCTSAVPLVNKQNDLSVQGIAFQAVYEHLIAQPQYVSSTPKATPTASTGLGQWFPSPASASSSQASNPTPTPTPTQASTTASNTDPTPTPTPTQASTTTSNMLPTPTPTPTTATQPSTSSTGASTTTMPAITPTPTLAPTPTPTPAPSPTPNPQNLFSSVTGAQPAYTTTLTAQDGGQWQTGTFSGGGSCDFSPGSYTIQVSQNNTAGICDANATSVADVAIQVSMTTISGDGGGIAFRDNGASFYRFRVDSDGTYALEDQSSIISSGSSSAIKTGQNPVNVLTVIAEGQQIWMYVNGQFLGNVTDNASSSGKIGLFAIDLGHSTQVSFSTLKVWTVGASASPTPTPGAMPTATPTPTPATTLTPSSAATPTPGATPTPLPIPANISASDAGKLYRTITQGQPAYTTSLAAQDGGQWQGGTFTGGGCGFSGGRYAISMDQNDRVGICEANAISLTNFALQVHMNIINGDGGGIVFRDNGTSFYRLRVSSDGSYDLVNQTNVLVAGFSSAIKAGAKRSNMLTIIVQGQQMLLYVNGQFLTSVTDNASASGKIGLFAVDFSNATQAAFSDLKVWTL
jgi:hypothetical protein